VTSIDWNQRQLCDDGGCTGIIGRDGRCNECGRASQFWGDERRRGMRDEADADDEAAQKRAIRELPAAEDEIAERRLCPDGNCTGLVGDDGRCKVCGLRDESAPVRTAASSVSARARDDAGDDGAGDADDDDEYDDDDDADDADHGDGDADDADDRRLCSDGSCTGLIGDDGKCRVCGRVEEL
jgi:hypothetical protein